MQEMTCARCGETVAADHSARCGAPIPTAVAGEPTAPALALARPGERLDQFFNALGAGLPALLLLVAAWQAWDSALHLSDVLIFFVMLLLTGFGITVGYHRLFTHRSFETSRFMRVLFAILGSAALEGPVIEWVAYHRRHHAYSDQEGDPHSPHVGHGKGWRGALRGLFYAHVGWVVFSSEPAEEQRYAKDLLADPALRFIDKTFLLWPLLGLALPFGLGVALTGTVTGGLTGLLWGGAVRIFVLHHVTFSINSICHFFGKRRFRTDDESRNVAWLSLFTLGEAWHHNHHAFPTSAFHGLRPTEIDPSAYVIRALERLGLVWNVVRISPERIASKAVDPARA
ncbi:MAG: acyl-CoA desaturase [Thermoleophilaceae bacterium]